jgi:hypothetical protein
MLEILKNFESAMNGTGRLSPGVMLGAGAAIVLLGLVIWLGGLGLRRILSVIAGAATGGILVFIMVGGGSAPALIAAAVTGIFALEFERVFVAIFAAIMAIALGLSFQIGPHIENVQTVKAIDQDPNAPASVPHSTVNSGRSAGKLGDYATDTGKSIRLACSLMPVRKWAIIVVLATIFIICGCILQRPTLALCFSILGTTFIFAGMILLLLHKGAAPVTHISGKPSIYTGVFAVMVGLGTAEQLVLFGGAKPRVALKGKSGKTKDKTAGEKQGWRT